MIDNEKPYAGISPWVYAGLKQEDRPIDIGCVFDNIKNAIIEAFSISEKMFYKSLETRSRQRHFVEIRATVIFALRLGGFTYSRIKDFISLDHSTMINANKIIISILNLKESNFDLYERLNKFCSLMRISKNEKGEFSFNINFINIK